MGTAWCGPETVPTASQSAIKSETPVLAETPDLSDANGSVNRPANRPADRIGSPTSVPSVSARAELAPVALFSLGSLAVGGAFYAIHQSTSRSNSEISAADRASLTNTIGAAGITALLAAGSYLWFTRDGAYQASAEKEPEREWDARVTGGVAPDGEMSVAAMVTMPLSFLTP